MSDTVIKQDVTVLYYISISQTEGIAVSTYLYDIVDKIIPMITT